MGTCYYRKNYTKIKIKLVFILFLLSIGLASFVVSALAAADDGPWEGTTPPPSSTGLGNAFKIDPGSPLDAAAVKGGGFNTSVTFEIIVSTVLTMVFELMGAIFLVLAIYAGYNWMTARGNEERVEKSKQTLTNAVIGIIVVLAAYAMVRIIVQVVGGVVFNQNGS